MHVARAVVMRQPRWGVDRAGTPDDTARGACPRCGVRARTQASTNATDVPQLSPKRACSVRQQQILRFIRDHINTYWVPPTIREVAEHLHIAVPTAYRHLLVLEGRGELTVGNMTRGIRLTNDPRALGISKVCADRQRQCATEPERFSEGAPVVGACVRVYPDLSRELDRAQQRAVKLAASVARLRAQARASSLEVRRQASKNVRLEASLAAARALLSERAARAAATVLKTPPSVSPDDVATLVAQCEALGVHVHDVVGPSRYAHYCAQRRTVWRALRDLGWSFPRIAAACSRDHATIMHGLRVEAEARHH